MIGSIIRYCAMNLIILESLYQRCLICGVGDLVVDSSRECSKETIAIYGRDGLSEGTLREKRCNNRAKGTVCRASYFYGYYKYKGKKSFFRTH